MQKYAKIHSNKVDNIRFSPKEGYIEVPNNVFGGMIQQEDGTFLSPPMEEAAQRKEDKLRNLIVINKIGKRFYADPEARTDITAVIIQATEQGATNEAVLTWKTPDGIRDVTLAELKEANKLALEAKAKIIGVDNSDV